MRNTLRIMTLVLAGVAYSRVVPAQDATPPLAYDRCSVNYDDVLYFACNIAIASPLGGTTSLWINDGAFPVRSPDGSKLAYQSFDYSGFYIGTFIVNLSDWSTTMLPVPGSPIWSPDGARIAASNTDGLYVMKADGSDLQHVSANSGRVVWSPDGTRMVFECEMPDGNQDICAIDADGANLTRLTSDVAADTDPAFALDGGTLAFVTTRFGAEPEIVLMNPDGSGVRRLGGGTIGTAPAWSPDGGRIAYVTNGQTAVTNADGSSGRLLGPGGARVVWSPDGGLVASSDACGLWCDDNYVVVMRADGGGVLWSDVGAEAEWSLSTRPVAWFGNIFDVNGECLYVLCAFDASRSWGGKGGIVSFEWNFGDGTRGAGATLSHTYPLTGGSYPVTLTVRDGTGVIGSKTAVVNTVPPPYAPTIVFTSPTTGAQFTAPATLRLSIGINEGGGSPVSVQFFNGSTLIGAVAAPPWELSWPNVPAGSYTLTALYRDNMGMTATATVSIIVSGVPLTASFTYACTGYKCSFDASPSQGATVTWTWSFGDGTTGTGKTVAHTYGTTGRYIVSLTVADSANARASTSQPLIIQRPQTRN